MKKLRSYKLLTVKNLIKFGCKITVYFTYSHVDFSVFNLTNISDEHEEILHLDILQMGNSYKGK